MPAGDRFQLSLASLNLHGGRDRHGEAFPVSAAIGQLASDVIVLQENWRVEGSQGQVREAAAEHGYREVLELDLLSRISLYDLGIVARPGNAERGAWGLAVLSRLPVLGSSELVLSQAPGDLCRRAAQVVLIGRPGMPLLRIVNTHLTHHFLHSPGQLRQLVAALGGGLQQPTLIAGDLNMCRPAIRLARGYRPAVRGRSWPVNWPAVQLDHILVNRAITLQAKEIAAPVGSDHLPVRVTLSVPGVTAG